jgi:hypothetical protein
MTESLGYVYVHLDFIKIYKHMIMLYIYDYIFNHIAGDYPMHVYVDGPCTTEENEAAIQVLNSG